PAEVASRVGRVHAELSGLVAKLPGKMQPTVELHREPVLGHAGIGKEAVEDPLRHQHVVLRLEAKVAEDGAKQAPALVDVVEVVGVAVGEVVLVFPVGKKHVDRDVLVEEKRDPRRARRAAGPRQVLAAEEPAGQAPGRGGGGDAKAPLHLGPPVGVRLTEMIGDGGGAVEALAGQALLEEELSRLVAESDVVLGGHLPCLHAIEHQTLPSAICCRSMLSKSARKLPAPKPRSPFRWMISKKKGPPRTSLKSEAPSFMKI